MYELIEEGARELLEYSDDQERDDHGMWTAGGSSVKAVADKHGYTKNTTMTAGSHFADHETTKSRVKINPKTGDWTHVNKNGKMSGTGAASLNDRLTKVHGVPGK